MKFTVILLRPDHATDNFGQDSPICHVEANTVADAIVRAQVEVNEADTVGMDAGDSLAYHPLAVFCGHLDDMQWGL